MNGNCWNLFTAMVAGAVFMYQVDLFCDWLSFPHKSVWTGVGLVLLAAVSFAVMLINTYLFMRA